MKKKNKTRTPGRIPMIIDRAKTVNKSIENGEKAVKLVKRFVIPAAVVGFAVLAYALFDIDVSGQARK